MDMSDNGAGGSASGITHTRGTGNSGYSGGVSGASVAPAAAVDHFNPKTDLAPVTNVVAASTASNVSSVEFAASAGANDNGSGRGDFKTPCDNGSGCCLRSSMKYGRKTRTIAWMKERRRTSNLKWK